MECILESVVCDGGRAIEDVHRDDVITMASFNDRSLIAVIGDEDSITGLLLAGIGHVNQLQKKNFLIVDPSTSFQPPASLAH